MARATPADPPADDTAVGDDLAAQYAEGTIDGTEYQRRIAEAGKAATRADAVNPPGTPASHGDLAGVTTADTA